MTQMFHILILTVAAADSKATKWLCQGPPNLFILPECKGNDKRVGLMGILCYCLFLINECISRNFVCAEINPIYIANTECEIRPS